MNNKNENGMALILTLLLLVAMMIGVLSFSRITTVSLKISQSGSEFRKRFVEQIGTNLFLNNYVFNNHLKSFGHSSNEYLTIMTNFRLPYGETNSTYTCIIKKSSAMRKVKKDIGAILYKKEYLTPGYQINSGGGKGTQHYRSVSYQCYTVGRYRNKLLTFRNWLQKTELE